MSDISAPHPARGISFPDLVAGLQEAKQAGLVNEQVGSDGLRLYCYSKAAVYDRAWTPFSLMARGLVLDIDAGRVIATPFPKFFNVGEREDIYIPSLPFETFEKLDGSLIIIFHHNGEWKAATKGALGSEQARWAQKHLAASDLSALRPGCTYLAEAIYPENRIVISYDFSGLVLLAAYDEEGHELAADAMAELADRVGWRMAKRYSYASVSELIEQAKGLPPSEEGFVLRFTNGLRLKVKGDEYRRIHAMVSRVTPLAVWDCLLNGDDLDAMRRDLPEEFWGDFDTIRRLISGRVDGIVSEVSQAASSVAALTDKDVGLRLNEFSDPVRKLIFPYRKSGAAMMENERSRQALFRMIRPTRNELPGYVPSSVVNRFESESA